MACHSCLKKTNLQTQDNSLIPLIAFAGGTALLLWLLSKKQ